VRFKRVLASCMRVERWPLRFRLSTYVTAGATPLPEPCPGRDAAARRRVKAGRAGRYLNGQTGRRHTARVLVNSGTPLPRNWTIRYDTILGQSVGRWLA